MMLLATSGHVSRQAPGGKPYRHLPLTSALIALLTARRVRRIRSN